jgi:hypothetical protein
MRHTAAKDLFIRLAHPLGGVGAQNYLASMKRSIGSAGKHMLADLWADDKAPDPPVTAAELAELLRIMRDESQPFAARYEAAKAALPYCHQVLPEIEIP